MTRSLYKRLSRDAIETLQSTDLCQCHPAVTEHVYSTVWIYEAWPGLERPVWAAVNHVKRLLYNEGSFR